MRRPVYLLGFLSIILVSAVVLYKTDAPPRDDTPPYATFGGVSLTLEVATTSAARERGLGGRTRLPEDHAMLFILEKPDRHGFWMKDMLMPIDIFWFDDKGQVIHIEEAVSPDSYPTVFYPPSPARYVLETNEGFARAHGITIGAVLELKNPSSVSK